MNQQQKHLTQIAAKLKEVKVNLSNPEAVRQCLLKTVSPTRNIQAWVGANYNKKRLALLYVSLPYKSTGAK